MRKLAIAVLSILLVFAASMVSAEAQPRDKLDDRSQPAAASDDAFVFSGPRVAEEAPRLPTDWISIAMWGEVWANGRHFGNVDFVLFVEADNSPRAQLWAWWKGQPIQVCVGEIFETPQGEPIFFGEATGGEVEATCHMARTPDLAAISLFIANANGQWATSIMSNPAWQRADAAAPLG